MVVYMWVTQDELQLPLYVADTTVELARVAGTKAATVRSHMAKRHKHKPPKFIRVEIEEDKNA